VPLPGAISVPIGVSEVPWAKAQSSSAAVGRQLEMGLAIVTI
jgi:hypothetical protein